MHNSLQGNQFIVPKPFNDIKQSKYRQQKLKKSFECRAAIEQVIGHLKADNCLIRNFCKGILGDNINVIPSAAAFNSKRMINIWIQIFLAIFEIVFNTLNKLFVHKPILLNSAMLTF